MQKQRAELESEIANIFIEIKSEGRGKKSLSTEVWEGKARHADQYNDIGGIIRNSPKFEDSLGSSIVEEKVSPMYDIDKQIVNLIMKQEEDFKEDDFILRLDDTHLSSLSGIDYSELCSNDDVEAVPEDLTELEDDRSELEDL